MMLVQKVEFSDRKTSIRIWYLFVAPSVLLRISSVLQGTYVAVIYTNQFKKPTFTRAVKLSWNLISIGNMPNAFNRRIRNFRAYRYNES